MIHDLELRTSNAPFQTLIHRNFNEINEIKLNPSCPSPWPSPWVTLGRGSAWILRFQRSDLDAIENGILEKVKEKRQALKVGPFWLVDVA